MKRNINKNYIKNKVNINLKIEIAISNIAVTNI